MEEDRKESRLIMAEECVRAGLYPEAVKIYKKLFEDYGDDSFLLSLAWSYRDAGLRKEAMDCFESLFERELTRSVFTGFAYDELVRIYREEKQYDRLVDVCKRAAGAQPGDVRLLAELGDACMKAGMMEEAIEALKGVISMAPDETHVYSRLGEALLAKGDFEEGERAYGRAAEMEPETADLFFYRMADCYLKAGENKRAEQAINRCLKIRCDEPLYHCMAGDCLIRQGRIAEAGLAYEKAISLSPDSEGAFLNRWGNSLATARYLEEAIEVFRKALEKDEKNPFYPLFLAKLRKIKSAPSS